MIPKLIIFDLDGTLAPSKEHIDDVMAGLLRQLFAKTNVAIMSGEDMPQLEKQFLDRFEAESDISFDHVYLFPTSGAAFYAFEAGTWREIYRELLTEEEKRKILSALPGALEESGYQAPGTIYGETTEDRGSQISFSANGQDAPYAVKSTWDPTREKRERIAEALAKRLPEFSIRIGGTNTLDITKPGIDKAYGIRRISEALGIPESDIVYVGDAIYPGGNDDVVRKTGVKLERIEGPADTERFIREMLASV